MAGKNKNLMGSRYKGPPRLQIPVQPETKRELERVAAVIGVSADKLAGSWLDQAVPQLRQLGDAVEAIRSRSPGTEEQGEGVVGTLEALLQRLREPSVAA